MQSTPVSVVVIHLEAGGVLGNHPASADQLFLIVAGSGEATAGEERVQLSPGVAVLWRAGQMHETRAGVDGLTAIVVEGEDLARALSWSRSSATVLQ